MMDVTKMSKVRIILIFAIGTFPNIDAQASNLEDLFDRSNNVVVVHISSGSTITEPTSEFTKTYNGRIEKSWKGLSRGNTVSFCANATLLVGWSYLTFIETIQAAVVNAESSGESDTATNSCQQYHDRNSVVRIGVQSREAAIFEHRASLRPAPNAPLSYYSASPSVMLTVFADLGGEIHTNDRPFIGIKEMWIPKQRIEEALDDLSEKRVAKADLEYTHSNSDGGNTTPIILQGKK